MALISEVMIKLLNFRIEQEEQSSRLYKAMQVWLEFNGYFGAAKLYKKYSDEELEHAGWAYNYLLDLNIRPEVPAQLKPQSEFKGLPNIISQTYQHELLITSQCKELMQVTEKEGDKLTYQLALKYVTEQVQELGKVQYLVDRLTAFGEDKLALRLLDTELGGM